jgi:hypothetical protein
MCLWQMWWPAGCYLLFVLGRRSMRRSVMSREELRGRWEDAVLIFDGVSVCYDNRGTSRCGEASDAEPCTAPP